MGIKQEDRGEDHRRGGGGQSDLVGCHRPCLLLVNRAVQCSRLGCPGHSSGVPRGLKGV